jgi:hypothetical protein
MLTAPPGSEAEVLLRENVDFIYTNGINYLSRHIIIPSLNLFVINLRRTAVNKAAVFILLLR